MQAYQGMTREELICEREKLNVQFQDYKNKGLNLDMSRGKPDADQLDLSMGILDILKTPEDLKAEDGMDCRNYGCVTGLAESRRLIAGMLECRPDQVVVMGNSSLNVMYDTIARSMIYGVAGNTPWNKLEKVKFLCPVPGYDRHFAVTEQFGIEMVNVPLLEDGPDMDLVEQLVTSDDSVKGIWCIPKYSNPSGITFSDEVVRRFAKLQPKAADFRIFWDNAYMIHHLYEADRDHLLNILDECEKAGNPDMAYMFCSTSKVTFPGAGISAFASSAKNLDELVRYMSVQTIGYDKINQLRHVKFFPDMETVDTHMMKQAALIRPKFELVLDLLEREIRGLGIGSWYAPKGGYFISYHAMPHTAKAIVAKAKEAGMVMTPAGAPFPYGADPEDSVIRIAPTYPNLKELSAAAEIFVVCAKLASVELLLQEK